MSVWRGLWALSGRDGSLVRFARFVGAGGLHCESKGSWNGPRTDGAMDGVRRKFDQKIDEVLDDLLLDGMGLEDDSE